MYIGAMPTNLPGIDALRTNFENMIFWGPWEYNRAFIIPAIIKSTAVDAGNTPTSLLRPGLIMGCIKAERKWIAWDKTGAAVDGTALLGGILLWDVSMNPDGAGARDQWFGYVAIGGLVKASALIIPGNASAGINGDGSEGTIRTAMQDKRYILDDFMYD